VKTPIGIMTLEQLESVDWASLSTSFGRSAQDVPKWIRQLASDDPEIRKSADEALGYDICNEYMLSDATVQAVPFLIGLLTRNMIQDRYGILLFLRSLILSDEYATDPEALEAFPWYRWIIPTRDAIAAGLSVYIDLLNDPDEAIRKATLDLLSRIPIYPEQNADSIAQAIQQRIDWETRIILRALAIIALGDVIANYRDALVNQIPEVRNLFEKISRGSEPYAVLLAAAYSLTLIDRHQTPAQTVEQLAEIIMDRELASQVSKDMFGYSLSLTYRVFSALFCLGTERMIASFTDMLTRTRDSQNARQIAWALLSMIFKNREYDDLPKGQNERLKDSIFIYEKAYEPRPVETLTSEQRQAVMAVVQADSVWQVPTNLLENFGLPASREEVLERLSPLNK
jgi:hypothetical protein